MGGRLGHSAGAKTKVDYNRGAGIHDKAELAASGMAGQLDLGYNHLMNNFLVGVNLYGALSGQKGDMQNRSGSVTDAYKLKVSKKHAFGADVRLGRIMCKVLPYALASVEMAKWDANLSGKHTGGQKKTIASFGGGLGMEWAMDTHWALNMEWKYMNGKKINFATKNTNTGAKLGDISVKPQTTTFMVGVRRKI